MFVGGVGGVVKGHAGECHCESGRNISGCVGKKKCLKTEKEKNESPNGADRTEQGLR